MQYPQFGTVIHATLRNEDLLEAFADELERLGKASEMPYHPGAKNVVEDARKVTDFDSEDASDIVLELMEWLDGFAAPYCYFGAVEGDGSDFGFWPSIDSLEMAVQDGEITKVNDLSEATEPGEYMLVNDHGNVTFGYVDSAGTFHTIWDCV